MDTRIAHDQTLEELEDLPMHSLKSHLVGCERGQDPLFIASFVAHVSSDWSTTSLIFTELTSFTQHCIPLPSPLNGQKEAVNSCSEYSKEEFNYPILPVYARPTTAYGSVNPIQEPRQDFSLRIAEGMDPITGIYSSLAHQINQDFLNKPSTFSFTAHVVADIAISSLSPSFYVHNCGYSVTTSNACFPKPFFNER